MQIQIQVQEKTIIISKDIRIRDLFSIVEPFLGNLVWEFNISAQNKFLGFINPIIISKPKIQKDYNELQRIAKTCNEYYINIEII